MKKLGIIFSILFAFIISIPIINSTSDIMNAAEDNDGKEKIIDFDIVGANTLDVIAATETGRLYFTPDARTSPTTQWDLIVDVNGKPLENVTKAVLAPLTYSATQPYGAGMALRDDNTLYMWGINRYGQFGIGTTSTA